MERKRAGLSPPQNDSVAAELVDKSERSRRATFRILRTDRVRERRRRRRGCRSHHDSKGVCGCWRTSAGIAIGGNDHSCACGSLCSDAQVITSRQSPLLCRFSRLQSCYVTRPHSEALATPLHVTNPCLEGFLRQVETADYAVVGADALAGSRRSRLGRWCFLFAGTRVVVALLCAPKQQPVEAQVRVRQAPLLIVVCQLPAARWTDALARCHRSHRRVQTRVHVHSALLDAPARNIERADGAAHACVDRRGGGGSACPISGWGCNLRCG